MKLFNMPFSPVSLWKPSHLFSLTHYRFVVCFLLGNSPASEFYIPTFWNTPSVPSS
jgi:hypothetical protein